jgi:hypothetical protein
MSKHLVAVWFFIGLLLITYGVLILGAGIYDLVVPPAHPVVLANLHAGIWWGAFMLVIGAVYTYRFSPSRS